MRLINPRLGLVLALLSGMAFGQAAISNQVVQPQYAAPFSTVRVCPFTSNGLPCSPLAILYSDLALSQQIPNPYTTDQFGNYSFFLTSGTYLVQVTPVSGTTYSYIQTTVGASVNSIFGRSGAIVAQSGDYTCAQVTGCIPPPVTSVLGRIGIVTAQSGDYNVGQITGAAPTLNPTFTGKVTSPSLNTDLLVDGATYPTVAAGVAALPTGGTLRISAGTYIISSTINFPSNLDIECSPNNQSILIASAGLNAPMFLASSVNHIRMMGCVVDGNRGSNSNSFNLFKIVNSSYVELRSNHFQNNQSRALWILDGSTQVRIDGNEIDHFGASLPASIGSEGIAIAPSGATLGLTHILVTKNFIHDGNLGIGIFPSSNPANASNDIELTDNHLYANANDGFLMYSTSATGGKLSNVRLIGNESYCNGWPANGTGFSANCTAGFLQTGSSTSGTGAGFNMNSSLMDAPLIMGNISHDNFFEGFDNTPQMFSVVTTAGTTVTYVSGDPFLVSWKTNQAVRINGVNYLLSSVAGPTSTLTLQTSAGAQSNAQMVGMSFARAQYVGNTAFNNGQGNNTSSGHGFSDAMSYGSTYVGNLSYSNQGLGFFDQVSTNTSHTGDKSYNNNLSGGFNAGFQCSACNSPSYTSITTDDTTLTPHQTVGVLLDPLTHNAKLPPPFTVGGGITDQGVDNTPEVTSRLNITTNTNFGTPILATTLLSSSTNFNNTYLLQLNIFQTTLGTGCSAATNTATLQYTFTDPTGTTHNTVSGPVLSISAGGAIGTYASSVVSIPVWVTTGITWNAISTLVSTGCGVVPQYQVSVKIIG